MKYSRKLFQAFISTGAFFAASASTVSAELTNPVVGGTLGSGSDEATSGATFATYFINLWNTIITVGAIMVLIYFIWGAVEWITSAGEKGKLENARNRITQAIIGLVILVASYTLLNFISKLFFGDDFNLLEIQIPNALN